MTTVATNAYCEPLGIEVPSLERVKGHPEANWYSLLIVALLERGEPMTLDQVARRFEEAGLASAPRARHGLRRCKPARAPIYRSGDHYALDPHDDEADLWAFRLGLRPPSVSAPRAPAPAEPLPSAEAPLTPSLLAEAWREGVTAGWSAQRVALCVLDAHGGAMPAEEAVAFAARHGRWSPLSAHSATSWRAGAPIRVRENGRWELDPLHPALRSARRAALDRVALARRWALLRPDPAAIEASRRRFEQERAANARLLAAMQRVLIHAFPAARPEALVLLDVGRREITTWMGAEVERARERLAAYDLIAALDARALLAALGIDPGPRRLAELGPPQKSRVLNRSGRTLRITTSLLILGSCGISRAPADPRILRRYLERGERTRLRRRLEADAKALHALYQYGRLHHAVRLRWGFLDEMIPAPWAHRDEPGLYSLMAQARERGVPLEVVEGSAPGWAEPWSRAQPATVVREDDAYRSWLIDTSGRVIDQRDVQAARLGEGH